MMNDPVHAITGATGCLGSHVVEQLVKQGKRVRALVRPKSNREFLESINVELVEGDLREPDIVDRFVSGATHVYHCAAKTDNWGPWSEYEDGNIKATRHVVQACKTHAEVQQLVYASSVAVYGHPNFSDGRVVDETSELAQNPWWWDHYMLSKIKSEQIVRELGNQATIIRPTSFFGIRDLAFLPRVMRSIRNRGMWLFGDGNNLQNSLYVSDIASMLVLAATNERARGQIYNCCSHGEMTQQELIGRLCEAMQVPVVRRKLPRGVAHNVAFLFELTGRLTRKKQTPKLTRHALSVFLRPVRYSVTKAEQELGWRPQVPLSDGVDLTTQWLRDVSPELFVDTP